MPFPPEVIATIFSNNHQEEIEVHRKESWSMLVALTNTIDLEEEKHQNKMTPIDRKLGLYNSLLLKRHLKLLREEPILFYSLLSVFEAGETELEELQRLPERERMTQELGNDAYLYNYLVYFFLNYPLFSHNSIQNNVSRITRFNTFLYKYIKRHQHLVAGEPNVPPRQRVRESNQLTALPSIQKTEIVTITHPETSQPSAPVPLDRKVYTENHQLQTA